MNNRLRETRLERGISQEEIAKAIGVSRSTYTNYELGNREPSLQTFVKICDFFDISADYLLCRVDI